MRHTHSQRQRVKNDDTPKYDLEFNNKNGNKTDFSGEFDNKYGWQIKWRQGRSTGLTVRPEGDTLVITVPVKPEWGINARTYEKQIRGFIEETIDDFAKRGVFPVAKKRGEPLRTQKEVLQRMGYWIEKTGYVPKGYGFAKLRKNVFGLCHQDGFIELSDLLLYVPEDEMVDGTIIHELCHLKFFDHSWRFWTLVKSWQPNYEELDKRKIIWMNAFDQKRKMFY